VSADSPSHSPPDPLIGRGPATPGRRLQRFKQLLLQVAASTHSPAPTQLARTNPLVPPSRPQASLRGEKMIFSPSKAASKRATSSSATVTTANRDTAATLFGRRKRYEDLLLSEEAELKR
jgi:hypothetical protein